MAYSLVEPGGTGQILAMNIPALARATEKREAAYEIKFVVPSPVADAALTWARRHLAPDPHAMSEGDTYQVNSLYFDTPKLDVYCRNGSYGKAKYRVRRYGTESCLFLERKLKARGLVSKRRTRIEDEQVYRLGLPEPDPEWIGHWFRRRLDARRLHPRCQITYRRVARVGMTPQGPIRLTVDHDLRSFQAHHYAVAQLGDWKPILPDRCILELKFRGAMPNLFKGLLEELALQPQPVSKYRLSVQAFASARNGDAPGPLSRNGHLPATALTVRELELLPAGPLPVVAEV